MSNGERDEAMPWEVPILQSWSIVGMNHYHVHGRKHLFVSMSKNGQCIVAEGRDPKAVFMDLYRQASEADRKSGASK